MRRLFLVTVIGIVILPVCVNAQSCADFPYTSGVIVEPVQGGIKILATASVGVTFNDVDAVNDARDEATMSAKAMIAKFFQESATSDDVINKAVRETTSMQGDNKQATQEEVVERVKRLTNSSAALLRGVVPLGDCYTAGKELRVSVGLKPETIAAAGNAAGEINRSLASPQTPSAASPAAPSDGSGQLSGGQTGQPLNPLPSFNNSEKLKNF
jgi:hypothetical protein